MLGGRALGREDIFQFGLDLLEGCWHTYTVTPTGISPERTASFNVANKVWKWKSNDTSDEPYTQISRQQWEDYGFWSASREYFLRPGQSPSFVANVETLESIFYAYRLTGNKTYQDWAWSAFHHISAVTRAPYGYSAIKDVLTPGGWYQSNSQESFWLA